MSTTHTIDDLARAAYAVHTEYCQVVGIQTPLTLDDVRETIASGCWQRLSDPAVAPRTVHDEWVRYHTERGWTYGSTKDTERKTHPGLVLWDDLPELERLGIGLYIAFVRARLLSNTEKEKTPVDFNLRDRSPEHKRLRAAVFAALVQLYHTPDADCEDTNHAPHN